MNATRLILSNRFLERLMQYHLILFVVFCAIYRFGIDFKKHFTAKENTISLVSYYVLLTQTSVMAGEIAPRTKLGRSLLATHVFLSWFVVILSITPVGDTIPNAVRPNVPNIEY